MSAFHACYGLLLESEIELPLEPLGEEKARRGTDLPRVRLSCGRLPGGLPDVPTPYDAGGVRYGPCSGGVFVTAPNAADFLIGQSSILIGNLAPGAEPGDLCLRLALGFLLQLRGALAFHGSAACANGSAAIILGRKGTGKSTTAVGLHARGWDILCDDIVVVSPDGSVPPGVARARLLPDSYQRITGRKVREERTGADGKLTLEARSRGRSVPLRDIFVIEPADLETVESRTCRGREKLSAALRHLHSPEGIGNPASRLKLCAQALARTRLRVVRRPAARFALEELLDELESLHRR